MLRCSKAELMQIAQTEQPEKEARAAAAKATATAAKAAAAAALAAAEAAHGKGKGKGKGKDKIKKTTFPSQVQWHQPRQQPHPQTDLVSSFFVIPRLDVGEVARAHASTTRRP